MLVPDAETARSIYLAVEKSFFPRADPKTYSEIMTMDGGDSWLVSRTKPPVKDSEGRSVYTTFGGGQLEMAIDKCDGAISQVHFSR